MPALVRATHSVRQKQAQFAALVAEAGACVKCPALCERQAVLSDLNGDAGTARIMFIGEAPGRQGGDRTGVPFSGDQSGRNFERYIASINLTRPQFFITNAALCNPRTTTGANRKPSESEVVNCSDFLRRQLEIVNPRVVVTLGAVALAALRRVAYHQLTLKEAVGRIHEWDGRWLVPLYHPSPQVLASHRREATQLDDYRVLACAVRRVEAEPD